MVSTGAPQPPAPEPRPAPPPAKRPRHHGGARLTSSTRRIARWWVTRTSWPQPRSGLEVIIGTVAALGGVKRASTRTTACRAQARGRLVGAAPGDPSGASGVQHSIQRRAFIGGRAPRRGCGTTDAVRASISSHSRRAQGGHACPRAQSGTQSAMAAPDSPLDWLVSAGSRGGPCIAGVGRLPVAASEHLPRERADQLAAVTSGWPAWPAYFPRNWQQAGAAVGG